MSFENLKNNYSKLLEFLEKEKYSATVIRCVSREIKNILENAQANQWETYKNIYHAYEHHGLSKDVLRSRRHILRMIERYDVRGEFPDRLRRAMHLQAMHMSASRMNSKTSSSFTVVMRGNVEKKKLPFTTKL